MSVREAIRAYYGEAEAPHHRYRSWEHCYEFFQSAGSDGLADDRDHAALQLGFYLASWGMYRGSSFLLQHDFTVHRGVIDVLADVRFVALWDADFGSKETDEQLLPAIHELIHGIRAAYRPFAPSHNSGQPTDTLVSKVILGTLGCLPACDRYFLAGFKREGLRPLSLNDQFVLRLLRFCQANLDDLRLEQTSIQKCSGVRYPLMKLVDMYFWQIGFELDRRG